MKDWGEIVIVKIAGYAGNDIKSSDFPWCNALSSNSSQQRLGTSLNSMKEQGAMLFIPLILAVGLFVKLYNAYEEEIWQITN